MEVAGGEYLPRDWMLLARVATGAIVLVGKYTQVGVFEPIAC